MWNARESKTPAQQHYSVLKAALFPQTMVHNSALYCNVAASLIDL